MSDITFEEELTEFENAAKQDAWVQKLGVIFDRDETDTYAYKYDHANLLFSIWTASKENELRAIIEQDNVEPVAESEPCNPACESGILPSCFKRCGAVCRPRNPPKDSTEPASKPHYVSTGYTHVVCQCDACKVEPASKDWVMVPREPTQYMVEAASKTWIKSSENTFGFVLWENIYLAMIAAAPTTPKGGE